MLKKIDLETKLAKNEYKRLLPRLQDRLYLLQKASWNAHLPTLVIFEGFDAAGKGPTIRKLTGRLDPRGFKLHPIRGTRTHERKYPWLWRFWLRLPARGEWAIFDHSWYERVLLERVEGLAPQREWQRAFQDIVDFERTLADDGYLIIKFWLHISKREQKQRFRKLLKDPLTAWQVADWSHYDRYVDYLQAAEEMLERTHTEWGQWTPIPASDRRYTRVKVLQTLIEALEKKLAAIGVHTTVPSPT